MSGTVWLECRTLPRPSAGIAGGDIVMVNASRIISMSIDPGYGACVEYAVGVNGYGIQKAKVMSGRMGLNKALTRLGVRTAI